MSSTLTTDFINACEMSLGHLGTALVEARRRKDDRMEQAIMSVQEAIGDIMLGSAQDAVIDSIAQITSACHASDSSPGVLLPGVNELETALFLARVECRRAAGVPFAKCRAGYTPATMMSLLLPPLHYMIRNAGEGRSRFMA